MSQFLAFAPRLSFAGGCNGAAAPRARVLAPATEQAVLGFAVAAFLAGGALIVMSAMAQVTAWA